MCSSIMEASLFPLVEFNSSSIYLILELVMGDYEWMSTWISRNMLCELLYIKHKVLGDAQYIYF